MDISTWDGRDLHDRATYDELASELLADLEAQLAAHNIKILQTLPNAFKFGVVSATADEERFLHIAIDDVRDNEQWAQTVKLRRMSSARDWKGEEFHYCAWDELGEKAAEYLTSAYDSEVL